MALLVATGSSIPLGPARGSGVQCSLYELQAGGGKDTSPKLQFVPLTFFFFFLYYYSTHACLSRACLLFIREGFALSNSLHYVLDTEQIKISFTKSWALPHSWKGFLFWKCVFMSPVSTPGLHHSPQKIIITCRLRGVCPQKSSAVG